MRPQNNPPLPSSASAHNPAAAHAHHHNHSQQQQQPPIAAPRPQLSVSIWFLRNTQPLVPGATSATQPSTQQPPTVSNQQAAHQPPAVVECAEPGDLLYGCENDLLDTGTKPLSWGPQPVLHHIVSPKYFCGEALSALVTVRNTSARAAAQNCRLKVELLESSQRRQVDLLNVVIPSLAANGMSEYRLFTRIIEPGLYSLCAKAMSGGPGTTSEAAVVPTTTITTTASALPGAGHLEQPVVSVQQLITIECDRGVEEASRRVIQLPSNSSRHAAGKPGGSINSSQRFMVMFGLRNASASNPAALQHVTLVSKDPASVTVVQSHDLNGTDAHMTELLRVPVCTGASAASCEDSVMAAGEVRHFSWVVEYTPPSPSSAAPASSATNATSSASASAAQSGSTLQQVSMLQQQQASKTDVGAMTAMPFNVGVVEWQWRRAGGDGGAIRSTMIVGSHTAPPATAIAELSVASLGVFPSPCVVGEPCELRYKVQNRAVISVEVNAHVEPSALLPRFVFVGGSTCVPVGNLEPGDEVEFSVPVLPLQSGAFTIDAAFTLRDALPPQQQMWTPTARSTNLSAIITNIVCMQAT